MKKMTLFKQRAMYCKLYRVKVKEAQNYKFHRSVQREVLGYSFVTEIHIQFLLVTRKIVLSYHIYVCVRKSQNPWCCDGVSFTHANAHGRFKE